MRSLSLILFLLLTLHAAEAQTVCPRCGRIHDSYQQSGIAYAQPSATSGQAIAQARANYMARTGMTSHPPRSVGDWTRVGSMEGCGYSTGHVGHRTVPTCRPSGRAGSHADNSKQLVGDAVAYGRGNSYRVRIWR